jgi:hypothetical protein
MQKDLSANNTATQNSKHTQTIPSYTLYRIKKYKEQEAEPKVPSYTLYRVKLWQKNNPNPKDVKITDGNVEELSPNNSCSR